MKRHCGEIKVLTNSSVLGQLFSQPDNLTTLIGRLYPRINLILIMMSTSKALRTYFRCSETVRSLYLLLNHSSNGPSIDIHYMTKWVEAHFKICRDLLSHQLELGKIPTEHKTYDVYYIAAAKWSIFALNHVPRNFLTNALLSDAVEFGGRQAFEHVPKDLQTAELCLLAVKKNSSNLLFVTLANRTNDVCKVALKANPDLIVHVPDDYLSPELLIRKQSKLAELETLRTLPTIDLYQE